MCLQLVHVCKEGGDLVVVDRKSEKEICLDNFLNATLGNCSHKHNFFFKTDAAILYYSFFLVNHKKEDFFLETFQFCP